MVELFDSYALITVVFFPLAAAGVIALGGRRLAPRAAGLAALGLAVVELALVAATLLRLGAGAELDTAADWVRVGLGMDLAFRLDALSGAFVAAAAILTPLSLAAGFRKVPGRRGGGYALTLLMQAGLMGAFCAADLLLFVVFCETALLATYFIVALRDGHRQHLAAGWVLVLRQIFVGALLTAVLLLGCGHLRRTSLLSFARADLLHPTDYLQQADRHGIVEHPPFRSHPRWALAASWGGAIIVLLGGVLAVRSNRTWRLLASMGGIQVGCAAIGWATDSTSGTVDGSYLSGGLAAAAFNGSAYLLAAAGIALCRAYMRRIEKKSPTPVELDGLAGRCPDVALAMALCLLSLAGGPITAGFFGKVFVAGSAMAGGLFVPGAISLAGMTIAGTAALRAIARIYRRDPADSVATAEPLPGPAGQLFRVAITLAVTSTIILGVLPQLLAEPLGRLLN